MWLQIIYIVEYTSSWHSTNLNSAFLTMWQTEKKANWEFRDYGLHIPYMYNESK